MLATMLMWHEWLLQNIQQKQKSQVASLCAQGEHHTYLRSNPSYVSGTFSFIGVPSPRLDRSHCLKVREVQSFFNSRVPKATSLALLPAVLPTVQQALHSPWSHPRRKQLHLCHLWALASFPYLQVSFPRGTVSCPSKKLDPTEGLWKKKSYLSGSPWWHRQCDYSSAVSKTFCRDSCKTSFFFSCSSYVYNDYSHKTLRSVAINDYMVDYHLMFLFI